MNNPNEYRYCKYCGYYNIDFEVYKHEYQEHLTEKIRKGRSDNQ